MSMTRILLYLGLSLFLLTTLSPQASHAEQQLRLDTGNGLGLRDAFDGEPIPGTLPPGSPATSPDHPALEGSETMSAAPGSDSFLDTSLEDMIGDFSVQSQMIYILSDQSEAALQSPASLLNATSSVANVFLGLRLLHLDPETEQPSPWNAYMGFSYGLNGSDADLSPFHQDPSRPDSGLTTRFGVNITF